MTDDKIIQARTGEPIMCCSTYLPEERLQAPGHHGGIRF